MQHRSLVYASGMTYILIPGEIDLSIGSVGAVAAAVWIQEHGKIQRSFSSSFFACRNYGNCMRYSDRRTGDQSKINAFMVSLGMQFLLRGI